jgi:hypothetical protein
MKSPLYYMKKSDNKERVHYDDDTLRELKRYYRIEDHTELLRFIRIHGLKNDDSDVK